MNGVKQKQRSNWESLDRTSLRSLILQLRSAADVLFLSARPIKRIIITTTFVSLGFYFWLRPALLQHDLG